MSIDATVIETTRLESGLEKIVMRDASGSLTSLVVINPPECGLSGLVGCRLWGNSRRIMFRNHEIGTRLGHTRVRLHRDIPQTPDAVEWAEKSLQISSTGPLPEEPTR